MASADPLQTFLQLHLATDAAAVVNLPSVLSALSSSNLESSSHLSKWTNRVHALIHSREPGARWAGITLALHTSQLSKNVMIGSAQGWVTTVIPMLSRNESPPVWKASIRLLAYIFTSTINLAEFQRHVVIPNALKFSAALISLAEKQNTEELRALCLRVLTTIVPLYPSLHRQLASSLSTTSLGFLNGSPTQTPGAIVGTASKLQACLHTTGGKVGGAALWRKSVDETIVFCSSALAALRTTYTVEGQNATASADPLVSIPLNLDRLHCGTELLCHLLRAKVERPVSVPIKSLVNLCIEALKVTAEGPDRNDIDPSLRSMEAAAVPEVLQLGCSLTGCLARCMQARLAPHLTRILDIAAYQLEQSTQITMRLPLIQLLPSIFGSCRPPHEPLVSGRIIKTILPSIAILLPQKSIEESSMSADVGSKKGKKRARGFEGDEVFKVGRDALCATTQDRKLVLHALDALPYLLQVPNIPPYLQSLSSRLLLSLILAIPNMSPSIVANDPCFKDEALLRVRSLCVEFAAGSSTVLCKSLPLVVGSMSDDESYRGNVLKKSSENNSLLLDLMLHPRVPPLLRPLPALDIVALCRSEEGTDERTTRESLHLRSVEDDTVAENETANGTIPIFPDERQRNVIATSDAAPAATPPTAAIVIPAIHVRPAEPLVVQPTNPVPISVPQVPSSTAGLGSTESGRGLDDVDELNISPIRDYEQQQETLRTGPAQQTTQQPIQAESSYYSELTRMASDDDDDDEDIEIPTLNPDSDTESEGE